MTPDPTDVVKVASGEHVLIELYRNRLAEDGIEAKVLGESLEASFGTAIAGSVELWVHRADADRSAATLRRFEDDRGAGQERDRPTFPHPTDCAEKPHPGGHGPHPHYNADPRS